MTKKLILLFLLVILATFAQAEMAYYGETVTTDSTFYQLALTVPLDNVDEFSLMVRNIGDSTSSYQVRLYSDKGYNEYDDGIEFSGLADSTNAILYDTSATFSGYLVGQAIYNRTDFSSGTITDSTTTAIYAMLTGGTNNSWTIGDEYEITRDALFYSLADTTLAINTQAVFEQDNKYARMSIYIKSGTEATATFRVEYSLQIRD